MGVSAFFSRTKNKPYRCSKIGRVGWIFFRNAFVVRSLRINSGCAPRSLLGLRKNLLRRHFPPYCIDTDKGLTPLLPADTAVLVELERRRFEPAYVRTASGTEVDFLATPLTGRPLLIRVCADLTDEATRLREFRALNEAMTEHPRAAALVLTATSTGLSHAQPDAPKGITIRPAWGWMLAESGT